MRSLKANEGHSEVGLDLQVIDTLSPPQCLTMTWLQHINSTHLAVRQVHVGLEHLTLLCFAGAMGF